jgi:hypothetical protein
MKTEGFAVTTAFKTTVAAALIVLCSCSSDPGQLKAGGNGGKASPTPAVDSDRGIPDSGPAVMARSDQGFANRPPVVQNAQVKVLFENNAEVIRVFPVGSDPDGDAVTFVYEWIKNGEPAGSSDNLSGIKRGDQLSVKITPYDGRSYGEPKRLSTVVQNTNPRVLDVSTESFKDNVLICRVKGVDPDGDPVTYALVDPPQGATIDKESGLLTWPLRGDPKEPQSLKVKLTDGAGGEFLYTLTVTVTEEKVSVQPKAN